jgi:hypothetical protein
MIFPHHTMAKMMSTDASALERTFAMYWFGKVSVMYVFSELKT